MTINIQQWKHVFKLDPDKQVTDEALELLCESGTDAILVGGSTGVTFDNTVDLLSRIRRFELPVGLEVSNEDAIVPGFDLYFIPVVLNAANPDWIIRRQQQAVKQFGPMMPWEMIVPEGYLILNPDSAAARLTEATAELDAEDIVAYARTAERLFRMPIVYIEYSGTFGDMDVVRRTSAVLEHAQLFYGGGIDCAERAREAAQFADTIVVGNVIYTALDRALETVAAVQQ